MTISYGEFKNKYPIGSSVGKPFAPYDFVGECVSYWLRKAIEVDGAPFNAPLGNAADIPFNPTFLMYYEKVDMPKIGDSMFWGDDEGTWTSKAGHVSLFDGDNFMMNQNYNSSCVISRNKIFTPGFIGYYRFKGGKNMPYITEEQLKDFEYWKNVGIDALPYKDGVVNSVAWTGDMATDTSKIAAVINDTTKFKQDHVNDKPSEFTKIHEDVYVKKG